MFRNLEGEMRKDEIISIHIFKEGLVVEIYDRLYRNLFFKYQFGSCYVNALDTFELEMRTLDLALAS